MMMPYEAMETLGRQRREELRAEAANHRLARAARGRGGSRRRLARVPAGWPRLRLAMRRPNRLPERRPAAADVPAIRPARQPT